MTDAVTIGLASSMGMGAAQMIHTTTPSFGDVSAASPHDEDIKRRMRRGEVVGIAIVSVAGIALWKVTGKTEPLLFGLIMSGATIAAYEITLRMEPAVEPANVATWFSPLEAA